MITKRIDAVTAIEPTYRCAAPPAPKSVKIELTSRCNFACGFCAHRDRTNRKDMDFEFYKDLVTELRMSGVEEIGVFYIGESLLYPKLADAIKVTKDSGIPYVFLTTNGSLLDAEASHSLMVAGLDSIKVSFNNYNELQFRDVTRAAPSMWKRTVDNIKNARRIRDDNGFNTRIYASSIMYDGNQNSLMRDTVDLYVKPWVDQHYWLPLYSFGGDAIEGEKKLGYKPWRGNVGTLDNPRHPVPCWALFKEGHVTVDGLLSACCFDTQDKWIMGDLTRQKFMEAWNSPEFQKLRQAHLDNNIEETPCRQCLTC